MLKFAAMLLLAGSLAAVPVHAEEDEFGVGTFTTTYAVTFNEETTAFLRQAETLLARIEALEEKVDQLLNQGSATAIEISCGLGLVCLHWADGSLLIEVDGQ